MTRSQRHLVSIGRPASDGTGGGIGPPVDPTLKLDFDFTKGVLDPRVTFARAGSATYYDIAGTIKTAGAGVPRFDYDPVTHAPRGLLLEAQNTNLIIHSQDFGAGTLWTKGAGSSANAADATGPDGVANSAWSVTIGSPGPGIYQPLTANGVCGSIWLRAKSGTPQVYFELGGGVGSTLLTLSTTWKRYSISGNCTYFELRTDVPTPIPNVTIEMYGPQLEAGTIPTSYIPTLSAAVARAADTASMIGTNFSSWYNQSEGTFVVFARHKSYAGNPSVLYTIGASIDDANYIIQSNNGQPYSQTNASGATVRFSGLFPAVAIGNLVKFASAYKLNNFGDSCNGSATVVDTDGAVPIGINKLYLGNAAGATIMNGWLERLSYYNVRKSNADLKALTT